jgi:hypothetical protein
VGHHREQQAHRMNQLARGGPPTPTHNTNHKEADLLLDGKVWAGQNLLRR